MTTPSDNNPSGQPLWLPLNDLLGAAVPTATLVEILPTRVWVESGMLGERVVVMQHEGCEPFDYAVFGYDYRYTSNSGTWDAAHSLALALGATEPVEHRTRDLAPMPTAGELREQIKLMQDMLADMEAPNAMYTAKPTE